MIKKLLTWLLLGSAALAQPAPIPADNVQTDNVTIGNSNHKLAALVTVNLQAASTYTIASTDGGKIVENTYVSGVAVYTLPNVSASGFGVGFGTQVCNAQGANANNLTINVNSPSLIGSFSSIPVLPNNCVSIADLDGTNYVASPLTAASAQAGLVIPDGVTTGVTAGVLSVKPLPLAIGNGVNNHLTGPKADFVCTGTCTVTPPVPQAGYQFCVFNDDNVSTVITLGPIGSSVQYENTARTAYGTAGTGGLISGGAAADRACIEGRDATHYFTVASTGSWSLGTPSYSGPGDLSASFTWWVGTRAYNHTDANAGASTVKMLTVLGATTSTTCDVYLRGDGTAFLDLTTGTPCPGTTTVTHFCTVTNSVCSVQDAYDRTGNGHTFSQATAANQPIFHLTGGPANLPYLEFGSSGTAELDAGSIALATGNGSVYSLNEDLGTPSGSFFEIFLGDGSFKQEVLDSILTLRCFGTFAGFVTNSYTDNVWNYTACAVNSTTTAQVNASTNTGSVSSITSTTGAPGMANFGTESHYFLEAGFADNTVWTTVLGTLHTNASAFYGIP